MQTELAHLSFLELNVMLEHVRAGEAHLRKQLNAGQFDMLMALGSMKEKQHQNIKSDLVERAGNVANALNAIFTGLFGSWLGLSGFAGVSLGSIKLLIFYSSIAIVLGGLIGYYSYRSIKKQSKAAITKQKLASIQIKLLHIINEKRKEDKKKLINQVNTLLIKLDKDNAANASAAYGYDEADFFEDKHLSNWLSQLNKLLTEKMGMLPEDELYQIFISDIKKVLQHLKKTISKNLEIQAVEAKSVEQKKITYEKWEVKPPDKDTNIIKILTEPNVETKDAKKTQLSWMRRNLRAIMAGFFPTLCGSFGSMFVLLMIPLNLAKEFGKHSLYNFLSTPTVKIINFTLALMVTIFLTGSFIYNNRKAYKRDHELEKTKEKITVANNRMIDLNAKINVLEKIKTDLQKIHHIFNIIVKVNSYFKAT